MQSIFLKNMWQYAFLLTYIGILYRRVFLYVDVL